MPLDSIHLAREPGFRLGPVRVTPALGTLVAGDRSVRVEPRVMQVLIVLARQGGDVVARDALLAACWGGAVVGDDALNRCIQRLRAGFRDLGVGGSGPDHLAIETIPRIGYRLTGPPLEREGEGPHTGARPSLNPVDGAVPVPDRIAPAGERGAVAAGPRPSAAAGPALAPVAAAPGRLPRRRWRLLGVAAVLGLAALALTRPLPIAPADPVWSVARTAPLTARAGREVHPALSPDGGQVIFSARLADEANTDLFLQSLAGGPPTRLTTDPATDVAASYAPDSSRIAWVTATAGEACRIWTMALPGGRPQQVGQCRAAATTRPAFTADGTALVFHDKVSEEAPLQLYRLDLASGEVSPLTRAPAGSWGHSDPTPAPDGRSIAYVDTPYWNVADIHLLDLETGTSRRITRDGAMIDGIGWLPDGRIAFSSNRTGDWGLWTLRPGEGEPRLLAPGLNQLGRLTTARHGAAGTGRLVVESRIFHTHLVRLAAEGAAVELMTRTTAMDYDADAAADGTIAFISTRSGTPEIWVADPGGEPRMLTRLDGPSIHGLRWSPDGRHLAFAGARGGNWDIHVIARDGSGLRRLTESPAEDLSPAWSPDGASLYFSSRRSGDWRIWRLPVTGATDGEAAPMTGTGPMTVRPAADGSGLFVMVEGQRGIRFIPAGEMGPQALGRTVVADASSDDWPAWAVRQDGIWYIRRGGDGAPILMRARPDGGDVRELGRLAGNFYLSGLTVLPDGSPVTARLTTSEIDLMKLDLRAGP